MQAIIMAAGKGSRLKELTGGEPKSFLRIKGKRLIDYNISLLQKYGIKDIIIVTGYRKDAFEELFSDQSQVRLVFNPFYEMVNVLGSFYTGQQLLTEDFVYLHADTICESAIMEEMLRTNGDIVLPVDYKRCDEEAMKVKCKNNSFIEINKTMPIDEASGEFIGIAKVSKRVLKDLCKDTEELLYQKKFQEYFESAIQKVINRNKYTIVPFATQGRFWAEIDFAEDYERAVKEIHL